MCVWTCIIAYAYMCIEVLGAVFSGWSREAEVASRRRIRANAQEAPIVQFIMFIMFGIQASLWPLSQALRRRCQAVLGWAYQSVEELADLFEMDLSSWNVYIDLAAEVCWSGASSLLPDGNDPRSSRLRVLEVPVQKPSHLLTLIFSATYWFAEHCCG